MLFPDRFFLLIALSIIFPSFVSAKDFIEDGKELHDKYCVRCHSSDIYTRENRIVNSYSELQERVRQCELGNELAWFDEDINAVIDYLNTNYYKFEIK